MEEKEEIKKLIEKYKKHAERNGFKLNPDRKTVENLAIGLLAREKKFGGKYCPCRRITGEEEKDKKIICPCAFHQEEIKKDGHCFCRLFVK